MNFDERGIPGVSLATTAFTDAVEVQFAALGFEPAEVYTPHPMQNLTAAEPRKIADDAVEPVLRMLHAG
jgi:hypothetical protein